MRLVIVAVLSLALGGALGVSAATWSGARLIADPPIVASVSSKAIAPSGEVVGPARQDAYIGADDLERVADYVIDPGRFYVTACGFFVRDPIIYVWTGYLPLTVRRR